MRRILAGLVVLTACTSAPGTAASVVPGATSRLEPNAVLEHVTDGDTIDVRVDGVDERVRLIGIDTPETKKPNTPVQCFGPEATAFTTSLLPVGTALHLERDIEDRDVYGRLLAYAYRSDDGMFVNLEIARRGFARVLTIAPNTAHEDEFVAATQAAAAENIGLWAECTG